MLRICSGFLFIPGFSLNDENNGKELWDYPKVKQAGKNLYAGKTQHIADQLMVSVWSLLEDKRYDVFIVSSFLIIILYFILCLKHCNDYGMML